MPSRSGSMRLGDAPHQRVGAEPEVDDVGDGHARDAVRRGERLELRCGREVAVAVRAPAQTTASAPAPASRTRSLAASARRGRARACRRGATWMGVTCPGITRSAGVASGATAARTVVARSAALIPVETPWRASMEAP